MPENSLYNYYNYTCNNNLDQIEKEQNLLERICQFTNVKSIEEAKNLAIKVIPTKGEYTQFYVGKLNCRIVDKNDLFRISVDSDEIFICYNFEKEYKEK